MGMWRENAALLLLGAGLLASAAGGAGWYLLLRPDPAISACEWRTRDGLQTPSTYRRVSAKIFENGVLLKYDAQNVYGAVIRNTANCRFYLDGPRWRFSDDDLPAIQQCTDAATEEAERNDYQDATLKYLRDRCQANIDNDVLLSAHLNSAGISYPIEAQSTELSAN